MSLFSMNLFCTYPVKDGLFKDCFPSMTDIIADGLYSTISNMLCLQLTSGST